MAVTAFHNTSSGWFPSVDKLAFMWLIHTSFCQSSTLSPQCVAVCLWQEEILSIVSFVLALCAALRWIRTACPFGSSLPQEPQGFQLLQTQVSISLTEVTYICKPWISIFSSDVSGVVLCFVPHWHQQLSHNVQYLAGHFH